MAPKRKQASSASDKTSKAASRGKQNRTETHQEEDLQVKTCLVANALRLCSASHRVCPFEDLQRALDLLWDLKIYHLLEV